MKKGFSEYYAVFMMTLFIIYNLVLESLKIGGLLYQTVMVLLIIVNTIILITFRKKIQYKSFVIIVYSVIWLFSKNKLQCFFAFSNIIILCITGFTESHVIKKFSIFISIFVVIFFQPLFFSFLLAFGTGFDEERNRNDIYDDTHYHCDYNYEVYSYRAGMMDGFHYSIGKYYEILNIDGIIYISYNKRNERTKEEYEKYIKNHNCKLVGDKDGFR